MSNWENKSNTTLEAANILLDGGLYNPCVHSFYYSCVQHVYHIFHEHFGMEVAEIEGGSKLVQTNLGTHVWLRTTIFKSLKSKDKVAAARFQNSMAELCNKRVMADYQYNFCEVEDANKSKETAIEIMNVLKRFY